MRTIPKQKFTQEFRKEAVKLVVEQGISMAEAARRLGMSVKTLNGWIVAGRAFAKSHKVSHCFLEASADGASLYRRVGFLILFEYVAFHR